MTAPVLVGMPATTASGVVGDLGAQLDRWRDTGGVNAIFVATLSEAGYAATPRRRFYANSVLPPPACSGDALAAVLDEAQPRALAVYAIMTEVGAGAARTVPGWVEVLEVDVFGRRGTTPCFRNPDYRNLWLGLVEDEVKGYPVHGVCVSVERVPSLSGILAGAGEATTPSAPGCFCGSCRAQADRLGIDVDRAREGYRQLLDPAGPLAGRIAGGENPAVVMFRLLLRFPEVAAWESLWMQGCLGLQQQLFGTVKAVAPHVSVGWQIPRQYTSSPLYRALDPLAERARYSDFLLHARLSRPPVQTSVLGVGSRTADAFAADVLGDAVPALAGRAGLQAYVCTGGQADVEQAMTAGADGVLYTPELGLPSASTALKAAAAAVARRRDEP